MKMMKTVMVTFTATATTTSFTTNFAISFTTITAVVMIMTMTMMMVKLMAQFVVKLVVVVVAAVAHHVHSKGGEMLIIDSHMWMPESSKARLPHIASRRTVTLGAPVGPLRVFEAIRVIMLPGS